MTKKSQDWKVKYLEQLSYRDTPLIIINELKISYEQLKTARKDEAFQEAEKLANELFQERFYEDLRSKVKDNPALLMKLGEKVVARLQDKPQTVNIDTGDKSINILGITSEQAYSDTQKLLQSIASNKSLEAGNNK